MLQQEFQARKAQADEADEQFLQELNIGQLNFEEQQLDDLMKVDARGKGDSPSKSARAGKGSRRKQKTYTKEPNPFTDERPPVRAAAQRVKDQMSARGSKI